MSFLRGNCFYWKILVTSEWPIIPNTRDNHFLKKLDCPCSISYLFVNFLFLSEHSPWRNPNNEINGRAIDVAGKDFIIYVLVTTEKTVLPKTRDNHFLKNGTVPILFPIFSQTFYFCRSTLPGETLTMPRGIQIRRCHSKPSQIIKIISGCYWCSRKSFYDILVFRVSLIQEKCAVGFLLT